jgi:hypothetical protein
MVAATLVLATPCTLFAIEQAWIEPLLLAALVAVAWAWQRESSRGIIVALATAFSLKQHVALLAPLALCFLGWRRTIFAALAAGVACAPLVLWNLDAFWRTAVRVFYDLPARGDSLSLYIAAGPAVRGWLPYLLLAFRYECVATLAPRNLHGWLVSSGLLLGLFDLANKFSFFNEWALPAMLLAAGGAGAIATRDASVDRSIEV